MLRHVLAIAGVVRCIPWIRAVVAVRLGALTDPVEALSPLQQLATVRLHLQHSRFTSTV